MQHSADFDDLFAAHQQTVRQVLRKYQAMEADLDDLVQDVFVRIFRGYANFKGHAAVNTWIHRVTVNVFLDHVKKTRRAATRAKRQQLQATIDFHTHGGIDSTYESKDSALADLLFAHLEELPEKYRAVIKLRELNDCSYEDIAERLQISVGTVRSRLSRARSQLRLRVAQPR